MLRLIYTISIHIYATLIHIASLFNSKAKLWVAGRKNIFQNLESKIKNQDSELSIVWLHCASLGEFEQGRPLIEKIKKEKPEFKILLTFFSPSGYEIRKNYDSADYIFYLPADTPTAAKEFIEIVKPQIAIFVKYEFWFNYLNELKKQHIPTYLICGIFRKKQHFFKSYGGWFRKQLNCFTHFYLQDEASEKLIKSIGYTNTSVTGDTRFDRVFEISKNVKQFDIVKQFTAGKKVMIAGSTWLEDEKIISDFGVQSSGFKLIIAPHEIDESHIQSIIERFNRISVLRYSEASEKNISNAEVLIIDNIGMLSSLYQYGSIAFIGGGFGKGIHNILEAATFGLPIIFGSNYHKFTEAKELIQLGGAYTVSSVDELKQTIDLLSQPNVLKGASDTSKSYVSSHVGATEQIFKSLFE